MGKRSCGWGVTPGFLQKSAQMIEGVDFAEILFFEEYASH